MINFYQKYLSPLLEQIFLSPATGCRYHPSCSEYTKLAIQKYGLLHGTYKGILRILRCNRLFKGGEDYP